MRSIRTWLTAMLAASSLFAGAAAAQQRFSALLDTDNNPLTGCTVTTPAGTLSGFEWRVTATVTGNNPPVVTASERAGCASGSFGAPTAQPAGYPVGLNNGTGGADVVELSTAVAGLGPINGQIRVVALAQSATGADATSEGFISGLGGGQGTANPRLETIPTLEWLGISLLIFGFLLLARRSRVLRGTAAILLLAGAGLVYAANFVVDGQIPDWTGETPDALDAAGDATSAEPAIDLRAFFAATENANLFFRFDVAELQNLPDAPVAVDDVFTVAEDAVLTGNVINGSGSGGVADTDPDGDPLTATVLVQPANGTLVLNANGSFTYTPNANFFGTNTFTYTLSDGNGGTDTGQATITVTPVNDAPTAVADAYAVAEDTALVVAAPGVLGNDTDFDSATLTATLGTAPASGTLALAANGGFTYTPVANFTGVVTFTYTTSDGTATSAPATVTLTVGGNNDLPVGVDDNYTVAEDAVLTQAAPGVLANDTDADGDPLTATLAATTANGVLAFNPNGSFTYTPAANFNGTDTFSYTVADGNGGQDPASVTITVTPVNDVPVAAADNFTTGEDIALINLNVVGNDTIGDRPFTIPAFQNPSAQGGTVVRNGDNTFNYTPAANFTGTDTFTYTVNDADGQATTGTVTITVSTQTDPPVAQADGYTVGEGLTLNQAAPGVLANDSDPDGDSITAVLDAGPANASSFTLSANGSFVYTHNGSETTSDTFTYHANDGGANSAVVTVTITITPVNDPPVAQADSYVTAEDTPLAIAAPGVLANDTDAEGAVQAVLATGPANGALTLNLDGSFLYTPAANYTGPDSFTYQARDAASVLSAITTVSINVTATNDAPVANNDSYTTSEDGPLSQGAPGVLGNDTDPEGGALTATLVTGPANAASFTLNPNGSFVYTPAANFNGVDSFTYSASDGVGSDTATVTLTITPVDDLPVAGADVYATVEDTPFTTPSILANDTLGDTPTTVTAIDTVGSNGGSLAPAGGNTYLYTPVANFTGADVFDYTITDSDGDPSSSTITFNVGATNDLPIAVDDTGAVAEGGTLNVAAPGVLANDTDTETPTLTAVLVSGPLNGVLTLNPNGSYNYVHDGSETTSDSFTYRANDGTANSNIATVAITITPVNDVPVTQPDSYSVAEGGTNTIISPTLGVLANDSDPEGSALTAVLGTGPANASSFTLNADGTFTYTHNGSETVSDTFTYRASDGAGLSIVTTVTITVIPQNDIPVAVDNAYSLNEGGTLNVAAPGVLSNDTDGDNPTLTAVLVGGPVNASSFTLNADGSFTYVHNGSETTTDSFTYRVNDGTVNSNLATVTLTIGPVNDAPVAANDNFTVGEGGTLAPAAPGVLGNDTDGEGQAMTTVLVAGPANASSFTLNADGSFNYVHNGGGSLTDGFSYRATDGTTPSNVATVTITITPVNDAPVAVNDTATVAEGGTLNIAAPGVLANDTDEEANPLTAVLVSGPANAFSFTLNADGSYSYVHNGGETISDSFTYTAGDGLAVSNTATVSITVTPVDDPPVALDDAATLNEDAPAAPIIVLTNDTDVDGGTKLIASASDPANGTVVLTGGTPGNHTGLTYQPDLNFCGTDTFTYSLTPGGDSGLVTVTVTCINDAPIATAKAHSTHSAIGLTINAAAHTDELKEAGEETDVDDAFGELTVQLVAGSSSQSEAQITLLSATDGSFYFEPPGGFTGTATFQYQVCDDNVGDPNRCSAPATVSVNVTGQQTWFIDDTDAAACAANCTGSRTRPLVGLNTVDAQFAARGTGDSIFVFSGNYASGHTLVPNERLIGQGATAIQTALNHSYVPYTNGALDALPATAAAPSLGNTVTFAGNTSTLRGVAINSGGNTGVSANNVTDITVQETTVSAATGQAINFSTVDASATGVTFVSTTSGGGVNGISLANLTDTFAFGTGSLSGNSGVAFLGTGSLGTTTYAGTITKTSAGNLIDLGGGAGATDTATLTLSGALSCTSPCAGIDVVNRDAGTITFSGNNVVLNTATNAAVNLDNNDAATIHFSGGTLDIDTTTGVGFNAVNGATGISVQGAANTIVSTNATALNVLASTIHSNDLTFRSVSSSNAAKGIVLNNTGATGGLVVTGTGANGTGGTILNTTTRGAEFIGVGGGVALDSMNFTNAATNDNPALPSGLSLGGSAGDNAAIHVQSTVAVQFDQLAISGSAEHGINGHNVNGFSLTNSSLNSTGNGADEDGLHFYNMVGTSTISNVTFANSGDDNVNLQFNNNLPADLPQSTSGTLTITGGSANAGVLGSGYLFGTRGTMNVGVVISGVTTDNNFSGGIVFDGFDTAAAVLDATGAVISNNNDGVQVSANNGNTRYDVDNNDFTGNDFLVVTQLKAAFSTGGTLEGAVRNNNPVSIANGRTTDAISTFQAGAGNLHAQVSNNTITYGGTQRVFLVQGGQDGSGAMNTTITGNVIDVQLDGTGNAVAGMLVQTAITGPGNTTSLCADIGSATAASRNTFTHSLGGGMAGGDIRVRQRNDGTVRLPGYGGAATDLVAVANYLNGRNTVVSATTATADSSGFAGGAACIAPNIP